MNHWIPIRMTARPYLKVLGDRLNAFWVPIRARSGPWLKIVGDRVSALRPIDFRSPRLWIGAIAGVVFPLTAFSILVPASRPLDPLKQPALVLVSLDGRPIARRGAYKDVPVDVETLPPYVSDAFVAIEDRRFYRHMGIDLRGVSRAFVANARAGEVVQGGSTITQQLAKTAYLDSERTLGRKLSEAVIALWLEARLSKAEILSGYLSSVYFGDGVYGLRAASRHYFAKPPEVLTLSEVAMLAGLVKAPSKLNPIENPDGAGERARLVLDAMEDGGFISAEEAREAGHVDVVLDRSNVPVGTYFADWVAASAKAMATRAYGEVVVQTTLDYRMQAAAERTLSRAFPQSARTEAALVAITPGGAVRAMVGGRSYARSQYNRVTQAERQPGSAFKLAVYLAALRRGLTPDSLVENTATAIGRWRPRNFNDRYSRSITLRQAFAQSSNVAAVRLTQKVGTRRVIEAARDLGITSSLRRDPTLALGTSETTLLELAAAYATVAGGRGPVRPYGLVAESATDRGAPLDPTHRAALLDLLAEVVATGTGKSAALTVPTFGKTGTTQGYRDAVFVGFIDGLVVAVWVGNDDQTPMNKVTGGGLPAEIWRRFMTELGATPASARPRLGVRPRADPERTGPGARNEWRERGERRGKGRRGKKERRGNGRDRD